MTKWPNQPMVLKSSSKFILKRPRKLTICLGKWIWGINTNYQPNDYKQWLNDSINHTKV